MAAWRDSDLQMKSNMKKAQDLLKASGYDGTPIVILKPTDLAKKFLQRDQQIEGMPSERIDVAGILATNKAAIDALERRMELQQEWLPGAREARG